MAAGTLQALLHPKLFACVDKDGSGRVTKGEYKVYLRSIRIRLGRDDPFARLDLDQAIAVALRDREVDEQLASLNRVLITHMMEQPRSVKPLLQINLCARALERIGDHAVNLCEEVVYLVKGSDVRHLSIEEVRERFPPGS